MTFEYRPLALAVACALTLSAPARAAATDHGDGADLDRVVVTATRTAITADAALAPVEVIDRDEIQASQAESLQDLLRGRAGINLSNQGGAGKLSTLFLRGSESDHVLVLIDGVRAGSATSGLAAFQDLPIELIDRIEIVRGPRSGLYGADAIGGVIQIFTRRDRGEAAFRFHVGAGSHGRREGGIGAGGGSERAWFGFDAGLQSTDGINACYGAGTPVFAGCFTGNEPDRDGYRNHSASLRGGARLGETIEIEGRALYASGHNEYDGDFVNNSDFRQQSIGANLHWKAGERLDLRFSAGRNEDGSDNFHDNDAAGHFDTRRDSASIQADFAAAENQLLTFGADWLRDRVDSDTDFARKRRGARAVFAQYQGRFGAHDLQLALRRDDNDQFGGKTTGTVAWGMAFGERWRITAGYGTAFKAPTFNELYFPFFGNPALRPEASKSLELGLALRGERARWRLDLFETRVDDLIAFDASLFLPNNIDRARMRGAEFGVESEVFGWDLDAGTSWLDTENRSAGFNRGNALPRRAQKTARLELDRGLGDIRLGLTGIAESGRYDDLANNRRLGGFATLDLRAEYRFAADWRLQARLGNVFDRRYETAAFYNQPGREWSLMLRFEPAR